uniref:Phosphorylated adapter RNA export protein n=1 Tax=Lygus hesperus TaxID=30085 RepID=A0A0A9WDJ6_LYGHE
MDLGELEDGELEEGQLSEESDCGLDLYTPLQRPIEQVPNHHGANFMGEPSPEQSDSDEDMPYGKRLRMTAPSSQIPKKYCVWTANANDDITDILTSFGMDTPENDRNVENYPIPKEISSRSKIREFDERKRKVPTGRKFGPLAPIPVPKELEDVDITELNSIEEVAKQIAEKLQEPNLDLVMRIVLILGKTSAIEYFRKTREIESKGGLLIMNGSRRRTSGGVFIHLIRSDKQIPGSKLVEIFEDPNIVSINKAHLKLSKLRKRKKGGKIKKQLSNPPPSPEVPDAPEETLTELPTRADLITRDLISYEGMDFPDFP